MASGLHPNVSNATRTAAGSGQTEVAADGRREQLTDAHTCVAADKRRRQKAAACPSGCKHALEADGSRQYQTGVDGRADARGDGRRCVEQRTGVDRSGL